VSEVAWIMGTSPAMIERHYGCLLDGAGAGITGRLDAFEAAQEQAADQRLDHWRATRRVPRTARAPVFAANRLSGRRASNPRPLAWEANALPTELRPRGGR
jgi:hypothetical protein